MGFFPTGNGTGQGVYDVFRVFSTVLLDSSTGSIGTEVEFPYNSEVGFNSYSFLGYEPLLCFYVETKGPSMFDLTFSWEMGQAVFPIYFVSIACP